MSTNRRRPEQLTLLRPSELPVQFRLDRRTRERGLAHVAEIRQQLDARRGIHAGAEHDAPWRAA